MKLIDDVLHNGVWVPPYWGAGSTPPNWVQLVRSQPPVVFDISNVAEYVWAGTDKEEWHNSDFPVVAPPFGLMWMEYRAPSKIVSRDVGTQAWAHPFTAIGVLVVSVRVGTGWRVHFNVTGRAPGIPKVVAPVMACDLALNEDGDLADRDVNYLVPRSMAGLPAERLEEEKRALGASYCLLFPCLLAMSLLNCKNVAVRDRAAPPRLARKHQKKHGYTPVTYKTLEIGPPCPGSRSGPATGGGQIAPLHIARGHFKEFKGKGLFGKYQGRWWWSGHARGSASEGVVIKDYRVTASQPHTEGN